jgi:superfamily II DNA helicase RecQ
MTATCPANDVASIIDRTGLRNPVILRSSSARPNFTYSVRSQTNAKVGQRIANLRRPLTFTLQSDLAFVVDHVRAGKDAIIFVPTRKAAAQIYSIFQKALPELCTASKPCILPIHSSLSPAHRTNVLTSWKAGDIRLLIATSVLSNVRQSVCVLVRFLTHVCSRSPQRRS